MQTLQNLLQNIGPETADPIVNWMYGINGYEKAEVFYLFNKKPQEYDSIVANIYGFATDNCTAEKAEEFFVKNEAGQRTTEIDPLYVFACNTLFHRGVLTNFLFMKTQLENFRNFYTNKKNFLLAMANVTNLQSMCDKVGTNASDVRYMIYQNLRIFQAIKVSEIPANVIPNDKELYAMELIDSEGNQTYERLQTSYLELRGTKTVQKYKKKLNGVYINAMMLRKDGSLERFVIANLPVLSQEGAVYISDNEGSDKEMFATCLVQELTDDDDAQLIGAVGRRDMDNISIGELIMTEFNVNAIKFENSQTIETIVSDFYNKGFPISTRGNKLDYAKLKFSNIDIEKDFLKKNIDIMPFNNISITLRMKFLYEDPDIFFAKATATQDTLFAIDHTKVEKSFLIALQEFISNALSVVKFDNGQTIETAISYFYNKGFPVSIGSSKIDYAKLKFTSSDIEKEFLKRNIDIMPFNEIPMAYRMRFLYEDPDIFFAKAVPAQDILSAIDPSRVGNSSLVPLDEFVSKASDEKLRLETYKRFYTARKAYFAQTVHSLSKEGVQNLIEFNNDISIEEKLLGVLKTKSDDNEFAEAYLGNLLKEASATGQDYMFDYAKIISEIGRGKSDLEVTSIMFATKAFQSVGDMKAYKFVTYILGKQSNENDMLEVIETFFAQKPNMNLEFFNIIAKQLVSEFLHKKNVLPGAIKSIEESVHEFMGILGKEDNPSLTTKFLSFFKKEDDFQTLSNVRSNEEKIDKIKGNGDSLIKTLLTKYQTNLDFIVKYKEYFEPSFYTIMVANLEESKHRILILQKALQEV